MYDVDFLDKSVVYILMVRMHHEYEVLTSSPLVKKCHQERERERERERCRKPDFLPPLVLGLSILRTATLALVYRYPPEAAKKPTVKSCGMGFNKPPNRCQHKMCVRSWRAACVFDCYAKQVCVKHCARVCYESYPEKTAAQRMSFFLV
jgi:hypothetical protein